MKTVGIQQIAKYLGVATITAQKVIAEAHLQPVTSYKLAKGQMHLYDIVDLPALEHTLAKRKARIAKEARERGRNMSKNLSPRKSGNSINDRLVRVEGMLAELLARQPLVATQYPTPPTPNSSGFVLTDSLSTTVF